MVGVWQAAALLFDNDGVLVDSTVAGEAAWAAWAVAHGLDPAAVLTGIHGRRSRETVARFLPADQVAEATAEIDAHEMGTATRTRPLPGPYLLAAQRLGVDVADCVVLEDSATGIAAARAAHAGAVIGVGDSARGGAATR